MSEPILHLTQSQLDGHIQAAINAALTNATHIASTTSRSGKIDAAPPKQFKGTPEDVQGFISRMETYFLASGNTNLDDQRKIAYTLSYMTDDPSAFAWVEAYHARARNNAKVYNNWKEFTDDLKASFYDHHSRMRAIDKLMKLRQGNMPIAQYNARFMALASLAELRDATTTGTTYQPNDYYTLMTYYLRGLKTAIRDKCNAQVDTPKSIKQWFILTTKLAGIGDYPASSSSTKDPDAMDVDAIRTQQGFGPRRKRWEKGAELSESDKQEHRQKNLCFYCHIPGHTSQVCRKKKEDERQRGGSTDKKAQIKAILANMTEEEKGTMVNMFAEEGF